MASSEQKSPRAILVQPADNVATLLDDAPPGDVQVFGGAKPLCITALEPISAGHKIALKEICTGQPVFKYGLPIGHAVRDVRCGEWVHLHNAASNYDHRSSTLDAQTGAPTDTDESYR